MSRALAILTLVLGGALTLYPVAHSSSGTTMTVTGLVVAALLVAAVQTRRWLVLCMWAAGVVSTYAAAVARPDPPPRWAASIAGVGLLLVIELFERRALASGTGVTLVPRAALRRMSLVAAAGGVTAAFVVAADGVLETSGVLALALAGAAGLAVAAALVTLATGRDGARGSGGN